MPKYIFILIAACALLSSVGCRKESSRGTFTLRGRMLKDCAGTPVAGMQLRVEFKSNSGLYGDGKSDIGRGTTDAQGFFAIECENHGRASYGLADLSNNVVMERTELRPTQGSVVELGNIYETVIWRGVARLQLTGTQNAGDTLYAGLVESPQMFILPTTDLVVSQSFSVTLPGQRADTARMMRIYWGIGRAGFENAWRTGVGSSTGSSALMRFASCAAPTDTPTVTLQ